MAKISIKDVGNTATLAKLKFSGNETEKFAEQFNKIVGFVEKISELDTDNVKPTTHAVQKKNVVRVDEVKKSFSIDEIEAVAPKMMDNSIVVPRVIER